MDSTSTLILAAVVVIIIILILVGIGAAVSSGGTQTEHRTPPPPPPTTYSAPRRTQAPLPTFRVRNFQRPTPPSAQQMQVTVPLAWGTLIPRPPHATVYHNQEKCIICSDSIHFSYSNTGWARCPVTRKLIHQHCYSAWIEAKGHGCAVCQSNDHEMTTVR